MKKQKTLVSIVWIIAIILIWEIAAYFIRDNMKLPYLHLIAIEFADQITALMTATWSTIGTAGIGFLIGAGIGFIFAILLSLSKIIEKTAYPYLLISQMVPIVALAPICYKLFGADTSRIVIAGYITFFPVSTNMLSGLKSVESEQKDLMYSYAAKKFTVYTKLMIPFSLPSLFSGLKIAAPLSVTSAVLIEMMSSQGVSIGSRMLYSLYNSDAKAFWSYVLAGALLGIVLYLIIVLLEKIIIPWKTKTLSKGGDV